MMLIISLVCTIIFIVLFC